MSLHLDEPDRAMLAGDQGEAARFAMALLAAFARAVSVASLLTDTCTYLTPILKQLQSAVMTNSGKWAHDAPGHLGIDVAFGELSKS